MFFFFGIWVEVCYFFFIIFLFCDGYLFGVLVKMVDRSFGIV